MNQLHKESSLYLQQHKNNPVHWYPWSDEAWDRAKSENKLVLVSIGYSSCHWCHVMEHETFEDKGTADIMNRYFICIKVDREERPDVDQVYMSAVQLMTGSGGWPLNCFTLPDGRPIYGGTYFPNAVWKDLLMKLENFFRENPDKAYEYAEDLSKGMSVTDQLELKTEGPKKGMLPEMIDSWKKYLDHVHGGPNRSPKFPLPNNYDFLLRYAMKYNDAALKDHVQLTLKKMAFGGIYDQLGGGFARYSVDGLWKVPHFEKMLYDNAQLISLYAKAYKAFKDPLYKSIVYDTANFLFHEMSDGKGTYYSAIDADSEGEEGKYYVWKKEELDRLEFPELKEKNGRDVFYDYFNINSNGYWEHGNYILLRTEDDSTIASKHKLTEEELITFIDVCKERLLTIRDHRIPPALDTKAIVSWNALLISALCEAYEAFGDEFFIKRATMIKERILESSVTGEGFLLHIPSQKGKLDIGFLEDYAFMITALIRLYECTFDEQLLHLAKKFADQTFLHFYDNGSGFFFFSPTKHDIRISRKKELHDNVIPSSNSEIAKGLYYLSRYFNESEYEKAATSMISTMVSDMQKYGSSYSNWAILYMDCTEGLKEVIIEGEKHAEFKNKISANYRMGTIYAGGKEPSNLPIRENRSVEGKTVIFVCESKTCSLPVEDPSLIP